MARQTPTRELVREIALEALNRGEMPTQAMIKRVIHEKHGITASPNLVMDELNKLLVDAAHLSAKRFALPDMPPAVSEAVAMVWEAACEKANEAVAASIQRVEVRERQAEQEVKAMEGLLAEEKTKNVTLLHDLALLQQSLEQKLQQLADLGNEKHDLTAKLDAANERNTELSNDKIRIESTCAQRVTEIEVNQRAELERVRSEHEKVVASLTAAHQQEAATWDGLRKHLLSQTDQIRQAARNVDESQRLRIADLERRDLMLTQKANAANEEISRVRGKMEVMQTQIQSLDSSTKAAISDAIKLRSDKTNALDKLGAMLKWMQETSPELHEAFVKEFGQRAVLPQ